MKSKIVNWRSLFALTVVLLNISIVGCGGPRTTVTGKVIYDKDGSPMKAGMVNFVSAEGQHLARGDIRNDGTFSLRTAVRNESIEPGKYNVCIVPPDTSSQQENGIITPALIDPRFLDTQTSGLQFEVKPGTNDFTLKVSKPAGS